MGSLHDEEGHDASRPRYVFGGPRVWAGTVVVVAGLSVIGVGGCFLIGAMALVTYGFSNPADRPAARAPEDMFLLVVLYVLAFASLAGGVALLVVGVRRLLRILLGKAGRE
jgi:hypothetical protein